MDHFSVFEGFSPKCHGAELSSLLVQLNYNVNPMMFVYTDGRPGHCVNFISVQLTYICLFLVHDFDYLW